MNEPAHRQFDLELLSSLDCNSVFHQFSESSSENELILPSPFDLNNIESCYWDTEKLSHKFSNSTVFLHQNIQGIPCKYDNFVTFLNNLSGPKAHSRPSVLAISETWLTDHNASSFDIVGYHPFISNHRKDNSGRGGVGLYIKDDIEYVERPDLSKFVPFVFESQFVSLKSSSITLGVIYRTPDSNCDDFLLIYEEILNQLRNERNQFFLLGDFNLDLLKFNKDPSVTNFSNTTFEKGCIPVITKPTRIGPSSATCIDNIIMNRVNKNFCSGIIVEDVSDHFPVFYSFQLNESRTSTKSSKQHVRQFKHNFSKQNLDNLRSQLSDLDWSTITCTEDPVIAASLFNKTISETVEVACPRTKMKRGGKHSTEQPWFTSGLRISSKRKNNLFKKAYKSPRRLSFYRHYRNVYNSLIKLAKKNYYSKLLFNVKNDMKKTWGVLNEIISKPSSQSPIPKALFLSKENSFSCNLNDPSQIAEFFNNFFSSVGQRISSSVMQNDISALDFMDDISVKDSFFLLPTSQKEIIEIVMSLESKSSSGHDNVSNKLVKEIIPCIAAPLSHIFNLSLQTGTVPDLYKVAKVIPLFKGGDKKNPDNYRPISLLPTFSKILEKIVYKRLIKFLLKYNILYEKQYGFLKGRSTEQAMIDIILKITEAIENKKFSLGVFLDLSKAFDSISHSILLKKLFRYGIRGVALDWFKSYLNKRQQYVEIDNCRSSTQLIEHGVPQGSVLGPLLFLVYVNDMPSVSNILNFILFADDTTCLFDAPSLEDLFTSVNNELSNLSHWFTANKLCINISKTNFIIFMTKQKERHQTAGNYQCISLNSSSIKRKDSTKFLGLFLDKNLTFQVHLDYIKIKLTKTLYALRRAATILPVKDMKILYTALFLPHINYGLLAWGGTCKREGKYHSLNYGVTSNSMRSLNDIFILQKRALRIVTRSNSRAHHIPLCYDLKLIDLPDLYSLKALSFCHDYFHGNLPPSLCNLFTFYYARGDKLVIKTQYRRTNLASSAIINTLPNIWNELPREIHLDIFKPKGHFLQSVKRYFFSKYKNWSCNKLCCNVCSLSS